MANFKSGLQWAETAVHLQRKHSNVLRGKQKVIENEESQIH